MDCRCVNARVSVTGDVRANVGINPDVRATTSVGTVVIRDGTNDYEKLVNKPSIEGHELVGDSTLPQIGVLDITPQQIDQIIFG